MEKKLDRWRKIAASAAEQSGRGRIPRVTVLPSYAAALAEAAKAELPILFYENEAGNTLSMALGQKPGFASVSLVTGPEGGLASRLGNLQSGPPDPAMRNRPFVRSGCGDVCRGRVLRGGARVHILRLLQNTI